MINDWVSPPCYSKFTKEGSAHREARLIPVHFHSCSNDEFKTMSMSKLKKKVKKIKLEVEETGKRVTGGGKLWLWLWRGTRGK